MEDWAEEQEPGPRPRRLGGWVPLVLLVGAAGGLWAFLATREKDFIEKHEEEPVVADAGVPEPDAGVAVQLPRAEGEAKLRELAPRTSRSSELADWLAAPDVLQRLAAAVRLVANGESPRKVLNFLEVKGHYKVIEKVRSVPGKKTARDYTETVFVSPESYARYDGVMKVLASIDPVEAGRAYIELRPYFESIFSEVARPGEHFDTVLTLALIRVVAVKVPEGPIELTPKGALYRYVDPALETLGEPEKHILRLGPNHARTLQTALRRFAAAAGLTL
jgi:hypothetical protein